MVDISRLTAAGRVRARAARAGDEGFAQALYLAMAERLLPEQSRTGARRHFREVHRQDQSWILFVGKDQAGWMQVEDSSSLVTLRQIHLLPAYRGKGIGGSLVGELLEQARAEGKPVALRVVKGNPALALYERLGFEVYREEERRLWMRWPPGSAVSR
jgi:GNAT superfamily N-acetyltransferase